MRSAGDLGIDVLCSTFLRPKATESGLPPIRFFIHARLSSYPPSSNKKKQKNKGCQYPNKC